MHPYTPDLDLSHAIDRFLELCTTVALVADDAWTGDSFRRHSMLIAAAGHARDAVFPALAEK